MKKKLVKLSVSAALALGLSVAFFSNRSSELIFGDVEALTASECISTSGKNPGHCEEQIDGRGDFCAKKSFLESANCKTDRED